MRIEILSLADLPELLSFYGTIADPSPFQHPYWWTFLTEAFRVEPHVLAAREADGSLSGYLLLYQSENIFAGAHISSLDDGMLVRNSAAVAPLLGAARELHRRAGKRYLLIRGGPWDGTTPSLRTDVIRTLVPIERGAAPIWEQLSSNMRRKVRKAAKNG